MAEGKGRPRMGAVMDAETWEVWSRVEVEGLVALGLSEAEARVEAEKRRERVRLRFAWVRDRFNAFLDMQDRADEAYRRQIEAFPEVDWEEDDAPVLPEPPEEAVAQAIYAEVMTAVDDDRWPRHLHFRDV
jgi:hypothetical protein